MPWIIWDILVPLLVTFIIGLGTGWLLWRWRRQRADISQSQPAQLVTAETESVDSANTILIRERDDALDRATFAEAELEFLKSEQVASLQGLQDTDIDSALTTATPDTTVLADSAEVESLNQELEKERATRAELDRSLLDLNSRYKQLSVRLEEAVNNEEAAAIKQSAAVESEVERSRDKIAEQQEALRQHAENEQQARDQHNCELSEKEAQLKQIQDEKNNLQTQLTQANAEIQNHAEKSVAPSPQAEVAVEHTSKVHRLSAYSPQEPSLAPGGQAMNRAGAGINSDAGLQGSQLAVSANETAAAGGSSAGTIRSAPVSTVSATSAERSVEPEPSVDQAMEPQPVVAPQTLNSEAGVESSESTPANVTSISKVSRKAAASEQVSSEKAPTKKRTSSGYVPTAWSVPEKAPSKAERDDLQEIKGVGPVLEKLLHKTGVWYFRQVALLDRQGVNELDDQLPQFSGRIQRDKWVKQAKALHKAKYGSPAS